MYVHTVSSLCIVVLIKRRMRSIIVSHETRARPRDTTAAAAAVTNTKKKNGERMNEFSLAWWQNAFVGLAGHAVVLPLLLDS